MSSIDLRYPVGGFLATANPNTTLKAEWIKIISDFPAQLRAATSGLTEEQLNWPYRPGGWSIRQVVHHCADSHANAFIRFKLALTEEGPNIKPYDEAAWAKLVDTVHTPINSSLAILDGLHARWTVLLDHLSETDYERCFFHPEHGTAFSLTLGLDTYQWHCRHHLAHVEQAKRLNG